MKKIMHLKNVLAGLLKLHDLKYAFGHKIVAFEISLWCYNLSIFLSLR